MIQLNDDGIQALFEEIAPSVFAEVSVTKPLTGYPSDLAGYKVAIARGSVPGAGLFRVAGRNNDIDDVREDVWEGGGDYIFPPNGGIQMRVVSTSAADDGEPPSATGGRLVDIHYLDALGVEREETLVLNGVSPVLTVATDILRVQDFHIRAAGTSGAAVGVVTLSNTAGTVPYATIQPLTGRCRQAVWTVPAGKIAFIDEAWIGGSADGGNAANYAEGYLRATSDSSGELLPGIFSFKWGSISASNSVGGSVLIKLPALCDVKMSSKSRASVSNVLVVGGFGGWYENDLQQS